MSGSVSACVCVCPIYSSPLPGHTGGAVWPCGCLHHSSAQEAPTAARGHGASTTLHIGQDDSLLQKSKSLRHYTRGGEGRGPCKAIGGGSVGSSVLVPALGVGEAATCHGRDEEDQHLHTHIHNKRHFRGLRQRSHRTDTYNGLTAPAPSDTSCLGLMGTYR